MTEVQFPIYPQSIALPILAFPSWILCVAPMFWQLSQRNIAAGSLILWMIFLNFFNSINPLIWPHDNMQEWWNGEDESDQEFDTDEDDENAEDYYANDYPEDELDSDDEFGRDPYQRRYRHGSDDEEYDLESYEDANSGDEDDEHFRRITAPLQAALLNRPGR